MELFVVHAHWMAEALGGGITEGLFVFFLSFERVSHLCLGGDARDTRDGMGWDGMAGETQSRRDDRRGEGGNENERKAEKRLREEWSRESFKRR